MKIANFAEVICVCYFPNLTHAIIPHSVILFPDTWITLHCPIHVIQDWVYWYTPSIHTHKQTYSPYQNTWFHSNGSCSLISPRLSGMMMCLKLVNRACGKGQLSSAERDPSSPVPAEVTEGFQESALGWGRPCRWVLPGCGSRHRLALCDEPPGCWKLDSGSSAASEKQRCCFHRGSPRTAPRGPGMPTARLQLWTQGNFMSKTAPPCTKSVEWDALKVPL